MVLPQRSNTPPVYKNSPTLCFCRLAASTQQIFLGRAGNFARFCHAVAHGQCTLKLFNVGHHRNCSVGWGKRQFALWNVRTPAPKRHRMARPSSWLRHALVSKAARTAGDAACPHFWLRKISAALKQCQAAKTNCLACLAVTGWRQAWAPYGMCPLS